MKWSDWGDEGISCDSKLWKLGKKARMKILMSFNVKIKHKNPLKKWMQED